MFRPSQRVWIQALVLAVVILSAFWLAVVLLLNAIGLLATVHDLNSPANSAPKAVVLFFLSGKWWMYLAALIVACITLVVLYAIDAKRNPPAAIAPVALDPIPADPPAVAAKSELVQDYHRLQDLLGRLHEFLKEAENDQPSISEPPLETAREIMARQVEIGVAYNDRFSQEVVKMAAYLKLEYGIGSPELSDENTLKIQVLQTDISRFYTGFDHIADELIQMVTDETFSQ